MDYYSILDKNPSQAPPEPVLPDLVLPGPAPQSLVSQDLVAQNLVAQNPVAQNPVPQSLAPSDNATPNLASAARLVPTLSEVKVEAPPVVRESLLSRRRWRQVAGRDGAQRDLDATLQLLAERAQYITGASGAAIALRDGESMVCCASSGPSAPELGAHLQIDSGLSAESVRTRQILRCDDAENDPRVNRESCKTFGIASVVVMPLVRGEEVYGVFELLSGRPRAFEDRDFVALNRLAEMIQTAVEHSEGARRAEKEFGQPGPPRPFSKPGRRSLAYNGRSPSRTEDRMPETRPSSRPRPGPITRLRARSTPRPRLRVTRFGRTPAPEVIRCSCETR